MSQMTAEEAASLPELMLLKSLSTQRGSSCNVEKFEQETFGTMLNGMDFVSTITCGGGDFSTKGSLVWCADLVKSLCAQIPQMF